jgi:type I restriction-modification system DNA methylase subunit
MSLLMGLYDTFKTHVFNELTISEFSDAFAQMLVYGLFLAKLNADNKEVTLYNAKQYIPQSFELIRELVGFRDELDNEDYKDTRWIIEETISIMNNLDLAELKKSLSFKNLAGFGNPQGLDGIETDPYIYFYETFLAAYDSKLRKAKGVYYTPPQVVNFIVRAINQVLKSTFGIENGFAQSEIVTVLDFATGTGTFLIEILKRSI